MDPFVGLLIALLALTALAVVALHVTVALVYRSRIRNHFRPLTRSGGEWYLTSTASRISPRPARQHEVRMRAA